MRTGLITFHFAHHYGAQLQAYATMRSIQALGAQCEIIDYRLPHTTRTNQLFKRSGALRDMVSDAHTALHYAAFRRRFDRFEAFVAQEMTLSPKRYTTFDQLEADAPEYDVYVAGSDQIWNPYIFQDKQFDPAFLLAFVREGRRIAYAPSLGVSELPEDKLAQLRRCLAPYSALSVREKRGQALLEQAAGQQARVVLDPTLLLTGADWGALAAPPKEPGQYILCYFVSDPGEAAPYAQALSQRTGWPILQLAGARRKIDGAARLIFDAGPKEFLGLFQNAAAVVTNSFHGAVFSLQFQKPFFTSMSPSERREPTYSRIYSLLSRLGCTGRIIGLDATEAVDAPMDYAAVHQRLSAERADSLAYLKAALEGTQLPLQPVQADTPGREAPALCRREDCTGCTACAAVCPVGAITLTADHEGFLRPVIGDSCILCRSCERVCPMLQPASPVHIPAAAHALWNSDEAERVESSSGGFFSLLARHTLAQGGAVFGVVLDAHQTARHVCARSTAELGPMRGSKYVQSDLGDTFRQARALLEAGTPVLFSGVPCQIDGLLRFLGRDYEHLLTCDLVCHGVPSPAVFRAWLDTLEARQGSTVRQVRFKDKSHGWSHPYLSVTFADGGVYTEDFNRTCYGRGFGMQLFLRPACAVCKYTSVSRPADFTLADYWGLDPALELPVERDKGVSMVLVNSARGRAVFQELSPRFGQVERPLEEAVAGNPRLASPLKANPRRAAFFSAFRTLPFEQVERRFLALPPLPYRAAAKALTPGMKEKLRRLMK